MTDTELNKSIEIAGEAVYGGFAEDDSFEHLLARAVLELSKRYKIELDAYKNLMDEVALIRSDL